MPSFSRTEITDPLTNNHGHTTFPVRSEGPIISIHIIQLLIAQFIIVHFITP